MLVRDGRIAAVGTRAEIEAAHHRRTSRRRRRPRRPAGLRRCPHPSRLRRHSRRRIRAARAGRHLRRDRGARRRHPLDRPPHPRGDREPSCSTAARRYRYVVPPRRHDDHRSEIRLRPVARLRAEDAARHSNRRSMAMSRPFSARTKFPTNTAAAPDDYIALLIHEMLPRVAAEKLAEYCDIFCEPTVFPDARRARFCRPRSRYGLGIRVHADQFTADYGSHRRRGVRRRHRRPSGSHHRRRSARAPRRGRPTGAAAGLRLRSRAYRAIPPRAA